MGAASRKRTAKPHDFHYYHHHHDFHHHHHHHHNDPPPVTAALTLTTDENTIFPADTTGGHNSSDSSRKGFVQTKEPVMFERTVSALETLGQWWSGNDTVDPYVVVTLMPWNQQHNTEWVDDAGECREPDSCTCRGRTICSVAHNKRTRARTHARP